MSSSTTWINSGGMSRSEERHLKSRIKKVFGEKISETLQEDFNGTIKITLNENSSDLFGDTVIGIDYESALDYINKRLYKLRNEKMKRL